MSKKYVIEMKSEYEDTIRGIMVLGARDSNLYTDALAVEDLEELNSDYINEHFSDLQDTAYQKGFDDAHRISEEEYQRGLEEGKKAFDLLESERNSEYQRGLSEGNDIGYKDGVKDGQNEAWEAARKIVCDESFDSSTLMHIFNRRSSFDGIFGDFSASEAIAKLKAYEEKQKADDKIEVGDEVETKDGKRFVVTTFGSSLDCDIAVGVCADGLGLGVDLKELRKTGRHFDIASILEAMKK